MDQVTSISLFVLAFALCLPLLSQLLSRRPRLLAAAKYFIFAVYVLANLYETILFRAVMPQAVAKWQPLWSYRESLAFDGGPLGALSRLVNGGVRDGLAAAHVTNWSLLKEIVLNILLYVPLGYLLPFTWPRLGRTRSGRGIPWRVVGIGFVCSALTEITQLAFKIGWFEFDDMINNTLGCLLGCVLYLWIRARSKKKSA